jgi:hypothetical protein
MPALHQAVQQHDTECRANQGVAFALAMNRSSMPKQLAEHSMTVVEEREEAMSQLFELVDDMSGLPCICGRANNGTCGCVPATAPAMLTATLRVEERSLRARRAARAAEAPALDLAPSEVPVPCDSLTTPKPPKHPQHPRGDPDPADSLSGQVKLPFAKARGLGACRTAAGLSLLPSGQRLQHSRPRECI